MTLKIPGALRLLTQRRMKNVVARLGIRCVATACSIVCAFPSEAAPAAIEVRGLVNLIDVQVGQSGNRKTPADYEARVERADIGLHGTLAGTAILTSFTRQRISAGRPVLFIFNGGPGSASAWLQMGLLGPKLLKLPSDPQTLIAAPYQLYDNPEPLTGESDLVFVDPVGTGFGRLVSPEAKSVLWSSDGDARYFAAIIEAWIRAHGRSSNPIYLVGESYGAQRAVDVAHRLRCLAPDRGLLCTPARVAGLVLISQSLAMANTTQRPGNDQGISAGLPTLAALAWYHRKVPHGARTLAQHVQAAASFADREYAPALFMGNDLSSGDRDRVAAGLARLTGLPKTYYLHNGLAMTKTRFLRELLSSEGLVLDPSDGRYAAPRRQDGLLPEAAGDQLTPAFAWAGRAMLVDQLGLATVDPYILLSDEVGDNWAYADHPTYMTDYDYPGLLGELLKDQQKMKVLIASGYYDTKASYGADLFLLRHVAAAPGRIRNVHYEGGHMFYTDPASRAAFVGEIRKLIGN